MTGYIKKIGEKQWQQGWDGSSDIISYNEDKGDDWSVFLSDTTRTQIYQLNFHTK